MAIIRRLEIENFRGIKKLSWCPSPGFNCLIGPGDAGKTTILDAIDLCLGARRNIAFTDADFFELNVSQEISISVVLGDLDDALMGLDAYGDYVRGYDRQTNELEEEPSTELETVLYYQLRVGSDLEPIWRLDSARADAKGLERGIRWADRELLSPLRLGAGSEANFSWKRGSLLNKLSQETPDASAALSKAAREARASFGTSADEQLVDALGIVDKTAGSLGIPLGDGAKAMLDVHGVSFGSGTISLHSGNGVPVRNMGTGSKRLLLSGMQHLASDSSPILLVDEIEMGLEPHRILRLLKSLGSKHEEPKAQLFATSHSPTVLRELSHDQIWIVRETGDAGQTVVKEVKPEAQGLLRTAAAAFLARSILVCEGKTEVGFVRGLDRYLESQNKESLEARGVALFDSGGGDIKRPFMRGVMLRELGYRVGLFMDSDVPIPEESAREFDLAGGELFNWPEKQSIERAIFEGAPTQVVLQIVETAMELNGRGFLVSKIAGVGEKGFTLETILSSLQAGVLSKEQREVLVKASGGTNGWFKDIARMEHLVLHVIGPNIKEFSGEFLDVVKRMLRWSIQ